MIFSNSMMMSSRRATLGDAIIPKLIAYWGFNGIGNEMLLDTVTNTNLNASFITWHGFYSNNPVTSVTGKNGYCPWFDTTTGGGPFGGISIPAQQKFRPSTFTVSLWVKSVSARDATLFRVQYYNGYTHEGFNINTTVSRFLIVSTGENRQCSISTNTYPITEWTHLCVTYDSSRTLKVFYNGAVPPVAGAILSNATMNWYNYPITDMRVNIGATIANPTVFALSNYFNGYIDEIGYYNGVLTDAQITSLYNNGAGKFYPFNT